MSQKGIYFLYPAYVDLKEGELVPRPKKGRKVCGLPLSREFLPSADFVRQESVLLAVDEYEAVRLIDYQGFTQEECAGYMGVARTTVQEIYSRARRKLARMLVEARPLRIDGGPIGCAMDRSLLVAVGGANDIARKVLFVARLRPARKWIQRRRRDRMKIAVPYENGQIFQHFGHTECFKLYPVQDGQVTGPVLLDTNGSGHGALAQLLQEQGVDTLICGGDWRRRAERLGPGGGSRSILA